MVPAKNTLSTLLVITILGANLLVPTAAIHAEEDGGDAVPIPEETIDTESDTENADDADTEEATPDSAGEEELEDGEGEGNGVAEDTVSDTAGDNEEIVEENEDEMNEDTTPDEGEGETMESASSTSSVELEAALNAEAATTTAATSTETASSTALASSSSTTTPVADPTIESGTAVALANILNLVNTNFVNSDGVVLFSNLFESLFGTIDFRSYFNALMGTSTCSLSSCSDEEVEVNLANNAAIQNALILQALTGGNSIEANGGNATIDSGNAYAGANIINVANTNLVDSNYLLVTLNAFEDINGDIVFPSLSEFFSDLRTGASPELIDIESAANIDNNVTAHADSGQNTTDDNGNSHIETGDAHGATNVFNEINTSLVGGQSISVIFRVHGSWAGEIFGAPDNLQWMTGEDGSLYLFDAASGYNGGGNLSVEANNDALISNNVSVVALTGENHITGADTALISTGDAYAGANIINVANANIVGRNWILAIINIFGDFNGNIAFGRPDLWVGEQVEVPNTIKNGSELTYKMTVINNGDSEATNVTLSDEYAAEYLQILDSSVPYTDEDGELVFSLGDLPPGSATEITYSAKIEGAGTNTDITNIVSVSGRETDNNIEDNSDTVTVRTDGGNGNRKRILRIPPEEEPLAQLAETGITITRSSAETVLTNSTRASVQSLIVRNTTNTLAKNVILHDILKDPSGNVIQDEVWEFGDILPNEEIEIGYTITFKDDAAAGRYAFNSTVEGINLAKRTDANGFIDLRAPVAVAAMNEPEAEVAGASLSIPDRPSPLKPEDDTNLFSALVPKAHASETDISPRDKTGIEAYAPYIATIVISLVVIGGAMLRRMRQSFGASEL